MRIHLEAVIKRVSLGLSIAALASLLTYGYVLKYPEVVRAFETDHQTIELPASVLKTPEDRAAWTRFMESLRLIDVHYFRSLTGEEMAGLASRGIIKIDPHSNFFDPATSLIRTQDIEGEFGGVGIESDFNIRAAHGTSGVRVERVIAGMPAEQAGVHAGDIITHIEDKKTALMQPIEIIVALRGLIDTSVVLTITRAGIADPLRITVVRKLITVHAVKAELKDGGYGYIKIDSFIENMPLDFNNALTTLRNQHGGPLAGYIIDLRGNPGGLVSAADALLDAVLVASNYPTSMVTLSEEHRGKIGSVLFAGGSHDRLDGAPLLILVDNGSASASEIIAGVLQKYGRATIAGISRTFGKGTVQGQFRFTPGGHLTLTIAQYLLGPQGCETPVQGVGVQPDIMLKRTPEEEAAIKSGRFEEALEGALSTSTVSNQNCAFHFTVSADHKAAAYKMLSVMGLEPVAPAP
ncbi:MAG: PDZ domain-containing protein [Parcubacteria group bacterium]|nr:PDZ domain-containing protein [Parcubacteria group bacterium]